MIDIKGNTPTVEQSDGDKRAISTSYYRMELLDLSRIYI